MNQLPEEKAAAIVALLARGVGIRQTALEVGVSRETVRRYASAIGHQADAKRAMRAMAMPGCTNEERAAAAKVRRLRAGQAVIADPGSSLAAEAVQRLDQALARVEAQRRALERGNVLRERARKTKAKRARREKVPAIPPIDELTALIAEQEKDDRTLRVKYDPDLPYSVTGISRVDQ